MDIRYGQPIQVHIRIAFFLSSLFVRSQPASSRIMLWVTVQVSPCTAALVGSILPVPHSCQPRRLHRVNLSQCTSFPKHLEKLHDLEKRRKW